MNLPKAALKRVHATYGKLFHRTLYEEDGGEERPTRHTIVNDGRKEMLLTLASVHHSDSSFSRCPKVYPVSDRGNKYILQGIHLKRKNLGLVKYQDVLTSAKRPVHSFDKFLPALA